MDIGWPEILIIAVVILVLFGSKKLPDAARSLGRSMRILRTEVKGLHDDDATPASQPPVAQPPVAQPPAALPPTTPPATTAVPPAGSSAGQPTSPVGDSTDSP
ncbi:MAG TPA: Sec-independent protein translocase subunit TatA [Mycobacteriales bacterium]|nr:Sec-independent protein translocase subunit TatA [Mycobacteriales bacterium]